MADDVTEAEKTKRILALQALQRDIQVEWNLGECRRHDGGRARSTAASRRRAWELSGRTSGYTVVNFAGPSEWIGRVLPVRLTGSGAYSLRGDGA